MATLVNPAQTKAIIQRILEAALADTAGELDSQFSVEIAEVKWEWPNETIREENRAGSGLVVESPRNIIDTGNLDTSQTLTKLTASSYEWLWDPVDPDTGAHYAAAVHEGAAFQGGGTITPRPWTRSAIRALNPFEVFGKEVRKRV
jgi:hypothetical protein